MNPFKDWKPQDVQRHNARISAPVAPLPASSSSPPAGQSVGGPAPTTGLAIQPPAEEQGLNKTERAWLSRLKARSYPWLGVQAVTLKLGYDCRYTPDFAALGPNGELFFWEVKGFMRDDARVKLFVAARQFPWARFFLVRKAKGQFSEEPVRP